MDDLSAKVFRTYNASFTLQEELKKLFDGKNPSSYSQDRQADGEEGEVDASHQTATGEPQTQAICGFFNSQIAEGDESRSSEVL